MLNQISLGWTSRAGYSDKNKNKDYSDEINEGNLTRKSCASLTSEDIFS